MLNHLTWPFFIALLLGLALIYYLIVLGLYYVPYWRKPVPLATDHTDLFLAPDVPEDDFELAEDPVITDIDGLILDIKTLAETAFDPHGLRRIFQAYPGLKDSPHRPAINELVVSECERTGQHDLTEAEVDQCWN